MKIVAIVKSLQWGESASLCCNWNPATSSINTSFLNILMPIFIGHVLGTISQSNTHFFSQFTQHLMSSRQNQYSYTTLLVKRNFFIPLYIGVGVPCFLVSTLALHKIPVLTCNAQHFFLAKLGGNLTIFHWKAGLLVSNTDAIWAIPWSTTLVNACPFGPSDWAWSEVVNFVGSLNHNSNQVASQALAWWTQTTISLLTQTHGVHKFYPWKILHGLCK